MTTVSVAITGDAALISRLQAMPGKVHTSLLSKMHILSIALEAHITDEKLSGQVLNIVTGNLKRSVFQVVEDSKEVITATVASSSDVKYAAIHEFGGIIKHPGGTAYIYTGKWGDGAVQFVSNANATAEMPRTKPHDIPMPERSFMRSSLSDMKEAIIAGLKQSLVEGLSA